LPISIGNIFEDKLEEIWNNSTLLNKLRNRDLLDGKCGTCGLRYFCGGCRAVAYAVSKNYLSEDPQCWYLPTILEKIQSKIIKWIK
jgi:radical SAM protein with 4Fe4S-binding SPASM domain